MLNVTVYPVEENVFVRDRFVNKGPSDELVNRVTAVVFAVILSLGALAALSVGNYEDAFAFTLGALFFWAASQYKGTGRVISSNPNGVIIIPKHRYYIPQRSGDLLKERAYVDYPEVRFKMKYPKERPLDGAIHAKVGNGEESPLDLGRHAHVGNKK